MKNVSSKYIQKAYTTNDLPGLEPGSSPEPEPAPPEPESPEPTPQPAEVLAITNEATERASEGKSQTGSEDEFIESIWLDGPQEGKQDDSTPASTAVVTSITTDASAPAKPATSAAVAKPATAPETAAPGPPASVDTELPAGGYEVESEDQGMEPLPSGSKEKRPGSVVHDSDKPEAGSKAATAAASLTVATTIPPAEVSGSSSSGAKAPAVVDSPGSGEDDVLVFAAPSHPGSPTQAQAKKPAAPKVTTNKRPQETASGEAPATKRRRLAAGIGSNDWVFVHKTDAPEPTQLLRSYTTKNAYYTRGKWYNPQHGDPALTVTKGL